MMAKKEERDKFNKITRLEVIEKAYRKYVKWDCKIEPSFQDGGRTLKIFVDELLEKEDGGKEE